MPTYERPRTAKPDPAVTPILGALNEGEPQSCRPERNRVTDSAEVTSAPAAEPGSTRKRKGTGLDAMVLSELKQVAQTLGLKGTGAMRKGQLIDAIRSAQGGGGQGGAGQGGGTPGGGASRNDGSTTSAERPDQGSQHRAEH